MEINTIRWPDASLEGIDAGYDAVTIRVREETGSTKLVNCLGYIGFQMVGFWDEVIIDGATVHSAHPFIADCERRVKSSLAETGSTTRAAAGNRLLEITLIDGCRLWVCAQRFRSES